MNERERTRTERWDLAYETFNVAETNDSFWKREQVPESDGPWEILNPADRHKQGDSDD